MTNSASKNPVTPPPAKKPGKKGSTLASKKVTTKGTKEKFKKTPKNTQNYSKGKKGTSHRGKKQSPSPDSNKSGSVPNSIKNLAKNIFGNLESSPDKTASFMRIPLPKELETLIKAEFKGSNHVHHLFYTNYLVTLRSIAEFGDRTIQEILDDFPIQTIQDPEFASFMVIIRTLTTHIKVLAQEEQAKDTALQVENPSAYLEYLPDNEDETNQWISNFDKEALKRSGRAGYRAWATDFDQRVAMKKALSQQDPHVGRTISTASGGVPRCPKCPKCPRRRSKSQNCLSQTNKTLSQTKLSLMMHHQPTDRSSQMTPLIRQVVAKDLEEQMTLQSFHLPRLTSLTQMRGAIH